MIGLPVNCKHDDEDDASDDWSVSLRPFGSAGTIGTNLLAARKRQ